MTILSLALEQVFSVSKPDIAIYLAGADPYVGDRLGRLSLSKLGLATRDRHVLETLRRHGVPVAIVMAGGYADKIEDVVDIHATTVEIALTLFGPAFA